MTRIGITGHQHFSDETTTAWVHAAINRVLGKYLGDLVGVSSLAIGADQMFASLVLERRGELEVVLPFPEYREHSFGSEDDRRRYDKLIGYARVDVLPREGRSDEEAYFHAGRAVVSRCDVLLAVWDGAPSRGLGGTADVVAHARERARATVIIDPIRRTVSRIGDFLKPKCPMVLGDTELDAARRVGDPIVDPLVLEYLSTHGPAGLDSLTAALFRTKGLPENHPLISSYLKALGDVDLGDPWLIERGQRLFMLFGPEIFLILGSCSLPLAFAAGNGVQAIFRARRLKDDPVRRLYDTAQMVINVMQVGELAHDKIGWSTARKVRLIHALIRRDLQSDPTAPWCDDWGMPINQEDLAGTLLSFSVAVLHGLKRIGIKFSDEEATSYVYAWSAIGRLLGIDEALLASTEEEAFVLAAQIGRRQIRATPEGKLLAEHLMAAVASLFPLPGYANSLTHYFLRDTVFGRDVAQVLDLPMPNWTRALVAVRAWQKRRILRLLDIVPGARRRRSFLARRFVQSMILFKQPNGGSPFEVPEDLAKAWYLSRGR